MDPAAAVKGQNAFFPKISRCITRERRGGDLAGGKFHMRKELRRPFPTNNTGRAGEAVSTHACGGRLCAGPGRLHAGFTMDPTPARGPGSRSFPFRMRNPQRFAGRRSPGREIPHAPRTRSPRPPKYRGRNWRAGDRRSNGSNGRQGKRLRSSGCVCDRPRLWAPMRMRGTRRARYLQTLPQIYLYAAYLTQLYSYAEYAYAVIT